MSIESKNKQIAALSSFILLAVVLLINFPVGEERIYCINYVVDAVCLLISVLLMIKLYLYNNLDLLEPITLIGSLYIAMFFITPIYDLIIKNYSWFGYDLFQYGVKATLIAFAGFLCFYFCYTHRFVFGHKPGILSGIWYKGEIEAVMNSGMIAYISFAIYAVSLFANVYYLLKMSGNSLLYTFTFGFLGEGGIQNSTESAIGFVSMFSYCLLPATLLFWEFGKSKWLKGIMFFLMLVLQIVRGFRFLVIAIVISTVTYWYLKKDERPRLKSILIILMVLSFPIMLMTVFRSSIRAGQGIDLSIISLSRITKAIDETVWDNLRIYRNFYAMTDKIPAEYSYIYGRQMIVGTIIMAVPRILWPDKISTKGGVDLEYIVGKGLRNTGQAYPNIGEYYYALGIAGVLLFMCIYGIWARHLKEYFFNSSDRLKIIMYSVLLGTNLQLIIRGYTPSNFWYLVFSVLPIVVIGFFRKRSGPMCTESILRKPYQKE